MENYEVREFVRKINRRKFLGKTEFIDNINNFFLENDYNISKQYLYCDNDHISDIIIINCQKNDISINMSVNNFINKIYSIYVDINKLKIISISLDIIETKKSIIY